MHLADDYARKMPLRPREMPRDIPSTFDVCTMPGHRAPEPMKETSVLLRW